ncbi:hypothetical protein Hanom_Chr08g00744181 [Helianthus anomalus]
MPWFLMRFTTYNVMSRTCDLGRVRFPKMFVLEALMTDAPKLSAKHLIIYNVWEARTTDDDPSCKIFISVIEKARGHS